MLSHDIYACLIKQQLPTHSYIELKITFPCSGQISTSISKRSSSSTFSSNCLWCQAKSFVLLLNRHLVKHPSASVGKEPKSLFVIHDLLIHFFFVFVVLLTLPSYIIVAASATEVPAIRGTTTQSSGCCLQKVTHNQLNTN